MGLSKERLIEGLNWVKNTGRYHVGWLPPEPAPGEYLQYPHVFRRNLRQIVTRKPGEIISFRYPGGQDSLFSSREDAEEAVRLLRLGKSHEDINIRDPGEKKAKVEVRSAPRKKSYALTQIEQGRFIRWTEGIIQRGLVHIGQTNPELAAQIKEEIADDLIGFDPEKRKERIEAIRQLAALPEEANPLKEVIVFQFMAHPGDTEREASLLLIPSLTDEERKKALLQRVINQDPNKEIVAKAKALLGK